MPKPTANTSGRKTIRTTKTNAVPAMIETVTKRVTQIAESAPPAGLYPRGTYPVVLDGKVYRLALSFADLAQAEAELAREGHRNLGLMFASFQLDLVTTRNVFAASLRRHHPDIPFPRALEMVTLANAGTIALVINHAIEELSAPAPEAVA